MKKPALQVAPLLAPWFIVMVSVAMVHQVAQKIFGISQRWVDSYLDPVLLMPILLQLVLWERRVLFGKGPRYTLEWWRIALICVWVSFLAEVIFPMISSKFTADIYDVVCYVVGSLAFGLLWNTPESKGVPQGVATIQ